MLLLFHVLISVETCDESWLLSWLWYSVTCDIFTLAKWYFYFLSGHWPNWRVRENGNDWCSGRHWVRHWGQGASCNSQRWWPVTQTAEISRPGAVLTTDKTSYHTISQSLEYVRYAFTIVRPFWNLTGVSTAPLRAKRQYWFKFFQSGSPLGDLRRSFNKTYHGTLKHPPGAPVITMD